MRDVWESVWGFVAENPAEILAGLAIVVSFSAAISTHIGARATKRNAVAAETQAEAASEEARVAQRSMAATRVYSEIQALEAARMRIEQTAPSVVVTLDLLTKSPLVTSENLRDLPVPHSEVTRTEKLSLDYRKHQHDYLYLVLRGTLYNDGDTTTRVHLTGSAEGPRFYAGPHPVTGAELSVPQKSGVDRCYLLHSKQTALFEIRAARNMWDVLNHYRKPDAARHIQMSRDVFWFRPGSVDGPTLHVTVVTEADEPVGQHPDEPWDAPIVVKDQCWVEIQVERRVPLPKSLEYVHAELQQDDERIYNMRRMDSLVQAMRDKRE